MMITEHYHEKFPQSGHVEILTGLVDAELAKERPEDLDDEEALALLKVTIKQLESAIARAEQPDTEEE